ncbi:MAG: outer membrane lipoprotein chaperone LolA [Proteobacteria bacterium]|nr:outer membrane lipoprotein chaperone LolA [Pseudomonadota bacterium]
MPRLIKSAAILCTLVFYPLYADEPVSYSQLLSNYLSHISTLSGKFEQNTSNDHDSTVYSGEIWISKPNRFRVDTISPSLQSLVSDGTDFWIYDEELEQVIVNKLNLDLSRVPILLFSSNIDKIEDSYEISGYADEEGEYFLLQPVSETSLFQSLALEFHDGIPSAIKINAVTGQMTTINLEHIEVNKHIPEERFSFDVPDHVDVIDDR